MSSSSSTNVAPRKRLTAEARREVIEVAATEVFAEQGYRAASMDEIARRSGVSAPVLYDHFQSKGDLHRRLLERHFAELREIWRAHLPRGDPSEQRMAGVLDAWLSYVQEHPYAWRMLFADTSGEPEVQELHKRVAAQSRAALLPLLAREVGIEEIAGSAEQVALEMVWELVRAVLQGLALWWYENQEVPREQVLATAMNALWIGFERAGQGETWQGRGSSDASANPG